MEAIENIIHALESTGFDDREEAIQKLIVRGSAAVPALINTLADESQAPLVRSAIVYVLGSIGDARAIGLQ